MTDDNQYRVILFCFFLMLYIFCLAPSIGWEDSSKYMWKIQEGDQLHGKTQKYRLYFMTIGAVENFPLGREPWRVNLFHAVISVVNLIIFYTLLRELKLPSSSSFLAAFFLGLSHLFWHYAEIAKVYPFMLFFLLTVLYCTVRGFRINQLRWFLFAGFLYGVGWGTHPLLAGLVLPIGIVTLGCSNARWKITGMALMGFLAGLLITIYLYLPEVSDMGLFTWFIKGFVFSGYGAGVGTQGSELLRLQWPRMPMNFLEWFLYLGYQFLLGLPLGFVGAIYLFKKEKRFGWLFLIAYVAYVIVAFDFNVSLKINFYLPTFVFFAVWIAAGIEYFQRKPGSFISLKTALGLSLLLFFIHLTTYYVTSFYLLPNLKPSRFADRPDSVYKNRLRFYLWPVKRNFIEPKRFAMEVLSTVEPESFLIVDLQEYDSLKYFLTREQFKHKQVRLDHWPLSRPETELFKLIRSHGKQSSVYVGVQYKDVLDEKFKLRKRGYVFEVFEN